MACSNHLEKLTGLREFWRSADLNLPSLPDAFDEAGSPAGYVRARNSLCSCLDSSRAFSALHIFPPTASLSHRCARTDPSGSTPRSVMSATTVAPNAVHELGASNLEGQAAVWTVTSATTQDNSVFLPGTLRPAPLGAALSPVALSFMAKRDLERSTCGEASSSGWASLWPFSPPLVLAWPSACPFVHQLHPRPSRPQRRPRQPRPHQRRPVTCHIFNENNCHPNCAQARQRGRASPTRPGRDLLPRTPFAVEATPTSVLGPLSVDVRDCMGTPGSAEGRAQCAPPTAALPRHLGCGRIDRPTLRASRLRARGRQRR